MNGSEMAEKALEFALETYPDAERPWAEQE